MKRLGHRKTPTLVEGHQDCGTCHPAIKNRKAKEREAARTAVEEWRAWFREATGGYWDTVKCVQCALGRDCAEHPNGDGNEGGR